MGIEPVPARIMTMISRAFISFSLVLCLGSGPALADSCLGNDPLVAAKAFYQNHVDFYYADPAKLQGIIAPRLLKLLAMNYACENGEECALDSDPWVDAQDGDIAEPVTFDLGKHDGEQATVVMHYTFALSDTQRSPRQVALKMRKSNQCWTVDDMITPLGNSLADEIDSWFKTYGNDVATPGKSSTP